MKYTEEHEWIRISGSRAEVGISDHAQEQLGDVVFVELPQMGAQVSQGKCVGAIESVKAAFDLFTPVSGKVVALNEQLTSQPELVNSDAEGEGWLFAVELADASELDKLMDHEQYKKYTQ